MRFPALKKKVFMKRRRNEASSSPSSRGFAFAFLFGVVFASCFRRWYRGYFRGGLSSSSFSSSSSACWSSEWLGKQLERRSGIFRAGARKERGDEVTVEGEYEDDVSSSMRRSSYSSFYYHRDDYDDDDDDDVHSLSTQELLELSLHSARLSAYLFAKASWPAAMRMKRATVDRVKRIGVWVAMFAMDSPSWSSSSRDYYYDGDDDDGEGASYATRAPRRTFLFFARKVVVYGIAILFLRNGALIVRKVLVRRFGAKWMVVRATMEQKRAVIEERVQKGWRKAERAARKKVWEPLVRWTRRLRRVKIFWTQAVPRTVVESGRKFRRRTVRFLRFLGKVVPHAIFFYCAKAFVTRAVPTVLRVSVLRTRYCLASVGFLYPIFKTLMALEDVRVRGAEEVENVGYDDASDREGGDAKSKKEQEEEIEKWARYWVAIGPLALLADVPFLSTSVSLFWPSWLEMCCVFVLWLEMPLMNGAYFTVDTVFTPMYNKFASARRKRRREKKRRGKISMKSSGSASSLSMMMASALRSDADDETDDEYAEEDGVSYKYDDDNTSGDSSDDDEDYNDIDGKYATKSSKYDKKKRDDEVLSSSSSESAASESSLSLFSSRKKRRDDVYENMNTGGLRRRSRQRHGQGELPPLPPGRVENEQQRRSRRKPKTRKRGSGLVGYRNVLTKKLRDSSKRVIIVWLRACVSVIGMFSPRLGEISRVALENTTGALLACSLFFLVPGMFCRYGCAIAGVFVPCLKSLETIASPSSSKSSRIKATEKLSLANGKKQNTFFLAGNEREPSSGEGEGKKKEEQTRRRITTSRSEKLRAQLQYWIAWSLLWSLAREIGWFPLSRHLELAGIYWLQVFGGADAVSKKVKNFKDSIILEHQNVIQAALQNVRDDDDDDVKEEEKDDKETEEEKDSDLGKIVEVEDLEKEIDK